MVCRLVPLLVGGVFAFQTAAAQQAPRPERPALVVNMVVGGLPYDFVTRYGHNLSEGGFRRLAESGVSFTSARYDYMPTDRASSLATITTGTYPSVHGVVGERWCDVLTGEEVELIADSEAAGFDCEYGQGCYSNVNLIAPTLGDRLRAESPASKVVSIAADPVSAIVMAGLGTEAYWVNTATAGWTSSSRYMLYLPGWVERFNDQYRGNSYLADWFWTLHLGPERYVNRAVRSYRPAGGCAFPGTGPNRRSAVHSRWRTVRSGIRHAAGERPGGRFRHAGRRAREAGAG